MTGVTVAHNMPPQVEAAWIALAGVFLGAICTLAGAVAKDLFMIRHYVRRDVAIKYMLQRLQVYEDIYSAIDATHYVYSGEHRKLLIHCREQCAKNYGHVEESVRDGVDNLVKYSVADKPIREVEREELMEVLRGKMDLIKRTIERSM